MATPLDRLIKKIRKEEVAAFIGSGFSFKAGGPKVRDIIEAIKKEADSDFSELPQKDQTLRGISEAFVKECSGSRYDLISILKNLFSFTPGDTSDQKALAAIPHIKQIFTTNYDTNIEDAYLPTERVVITSNVGAVYAEENKVAIYKIHGDITTMNDPNSIVITDSDYKNYFKPRRFDCFIDELKRTIVRKHLLFIGYSLEDDNILEIIKKLRNTVGNNLKEMFLVAPGLNRTKVEQLRKNGVAYIDDVAENVLREITRELNEHIVEDYKHKKVSSETYSKFISIHGLYSDTVQKDNHNEIHGFFSKDGSPLSHEFSVQILTDTDWTKDFRPNCSMPVPETNFILPAIKVSSEKITSLIGHINGIKVMDKEECSSLVALPCHDVIDIPFEMKSTGFKKKLKAIRYSLNNRVFIDCESPICKIHLEIVFSGEKEIGLIFNWKFELLDRYEDNQEAISWADFLLGFVSGKGAKILTIGCPESKVNPRLIEYYSRLKSYYETVKDIECDYDIDFPHYDNYNEENMDKVQTLYCYLSSRGLPVDITHHKSVEFCTNASEEINMPISKFENGAFFMFQIDDFGEITVNGKSFNIPYKTTVFKSDKGNKVEHIEGDKYRITMPITPNCSCVAWFSDHKPKQEGNIIHLGNYQSNNQSNEPIAE